MTDCHGEGFRCKYTTGIISQCLHDALGIYHSQTHASIIRQCLSTTWIYFFKLMLKKWSGYGLTGWTASSGPDLQLLILLLKNF